MKKSDAESEIFVLTERLIKLKNDKKETVGAFQDEIKGIEKEIKDIVESIGKD
jgi:hypothetical protein